MSKRKISELSPELRESLRDCPYVVGFTHCTIHWSKKIYEEFCREYDKGIPAAQILEKRGIDTAILGRRIAAFLRYYERNWRMAHSVGDGVTNAANSDTANSKSQYTGEIIAYERTPRAASNRTMEKMSKLEHEVAYLNQEVEFLKKIFMLENPELEKLDRHKNTR